MTIQEVIDQRTEKVRLPVWAESAYARFDFLDGGEIGPWVHIKDPSGEADILVSELLKDTSDEWEEFRE